MIWHLIKWPLLALRDWWEQNHYHERATMPRYSYVSAMNQQCRTCGAFPGEQCVPNRDQAWPAYFIHPARVHDAGQRP